MIALAGLILFAPALIGFLLRLRESIKEDPTPEFTDRDPLDSEYAETHCADELTQFVVHTVYVLGSKR